MTNPICKRRDTKLGDENVLGCVLQVSNELQLTEDEKNEEHSCNASNRKRLKKKNETARIEEDKSFVEKAQENVTKRKNHEEYEENGMEGETDEEFLMCDNYPRKKLKKKNETANTEEDESFVKKLKDKFKDESFVKKLKDKFVKGKDHEEYGENGTEVEIIEEFSYDYSMRSKLKKKNETASTEEDESFVEKAQEKFTKGKYHEEHDENGMEDDMYAKFLCDYSRREQLEKKNEMANAEEDKSSGGKAQEEVSKGKSQEESVDNGKIHMNEEENDSEKHYKGKNIDSTPGDTPIKGGDGKSAFPASVMEEFLASVKNEFLAVMREEFLVSMKKAFLASMREEFLSSVREEFRDSMREEVRKTVGEEISTSRVNSAMRAEVSVNMTGSKRQTNITDELHAVLSEAEDNYEDKCSVKRKRERNNPRIEGDIRCFSVHLFQSPPHDEKEEFDQWIEVGLKRNRRNKYSDTLNKLDPVFDFNIDTCKQKDWFYSLNETGQWLNSAHIDVALYFVRMKKKDHPDVFKPRCTTTDWLFPAILNARYPRFKKDPEKFSWDKEAFIQKTLKGIEPRHSLPWVDVDTIYIPPNIVRKHWVALVLHPKRWTLYVYDSYRAAKHDKEVMLACRPIAEMVPCILKSVGFFDARKDLKEATSPLDVELIDGNPTTG
ncbi:Ulp1 protease family, C-terminal catalytic domain containing protein [Parasponia andersonii]|uniref:Ulp1 protease family, C-terminal catalytic domain containing protein n=1 Tax=Parasponia andersonii TaxID=3476 RepID=A0A2P5AQW1_PARAD|nr:Ulp1 protease family, C-terminal catalytic domain containing protein [Parasponia andersonii]